MSTGTKVGDTCHWVASGVSYSLNESLLGAGGISKRGDSFVLTENLVSSNRDRSGVGLFDFVDNEAEQIKRWGRVLVAPGEAPSDMHRWTAGTIEEDLAREAAQKVANAIADDQQRAIALAEVRSTFGLGNASNQRSSYSPGDVERDKILAAEGRR